MANQLVWVDIPARDLDRAARFYTAVLGAPVRTQEYSGFSIALLPGGEGEVSGCIYVAGNDNAPGQTGPLVYCNCDGRLDAAESAVAPAGGTVLQSKHAIGPHGFRVLVVDSEGNRIALHSH